ncbi:MAG: hypothetical protein WCL44_10315 [bacterium]
MSITPLVQSATPARRSESGLRAILSALVGNRGAQCAAVRDSEKIEVLEFRRINTADRFEMRFGWWSRIYEYPMVLDMINKHVGRKDICVHNTSWGFEGCHIAFKDILESSYEAVVNTDVQPSELPNTGVWDITTPPRTEYLNHFDVVVNVSTMEEVDCDHLSIFDNLFSQVKAGGILVCTFDLPGLQLKKFENLFGKVLATAGNDINGKISALPHMKYEHLTCGIMVVRKMLKCPAHCDACA